MRLEVRRANLDDDLRDLFEQYGEQVVAMALVPGGIGIVFAPRTPPRPSWRLVRSIVAMLVSSAAAIRWLNVSCKLRLRVSAIDITPALGSNQGTGLRTHPVAIHLSRMM